MLPLWIIDLREKSSRRDFFESLVGQIDHVYINIKEGRDSHLDSGSVPTSEDPVVSGDDIAATEDFTDTSNTDLDDQPDKADKKSAIIGDYWRYSRMEDFFYGIRITDDVSAKLSNFDADHILFDVEKVPTAKGTAERLYRFQSDLIVEGQKFIRQLRDSNAHPDIKINIVVLGDLTEDFTRIVFPAIAGLLQKEKGRILPHHIHQGMEIIGMLYIPSDINTRDVNTRRSMQRTLNEIDVQHRVNDIRGYDHMMLYQDVQNRTECTYPILNDEQLAEYLLQCIVHLYLACSDTHPLLSGTSSADVFYFSMGAASVYYDAEKEDLKARHEMAIECVRNFKSEGDDTKEKQKLYIFSDDDYEPTNFFDFNALDAISTDDVHSDPPLHPVRNFFAKYLKRYYYGIYLRFFTEKLLQKTINQIDDNTREALGLIASNCKSRFNDAQAHIKRRIDDILYTISANDGGLPAIERVFKDMQDSFSRRKQRIRTTLDQEFWRKVEELHISKSLIDRFTEYHDAYIADIDAKNGGSNQLEMKQQAVNDLNDILSREATMLSRICRSILLGIMLALALVPILNMMSPHVIDLGNVKGHALWWSLGLFFVPVIVQLISFWRYGRSKKRAVNNLKAMYLHDAYARVGNRIESEINSFYDKMIALGDKYISRCDEIRNDLGKDLIKDQVIKPLFPETMFNQPLVGGNFGGDALLPDKEAANTQVRINFIRYKLSELTKTHYFLFINQNKNIFKKLFDEVRLCENLIRRVKDNGEQELVTKQQQEAELRTAWDGLRDEFNRELRGSVKKAIVKSEEATVGEKLSHFCRLSKDNEGILESMIRYAASNGEVTSSADIEFCDAKMNDKSVIEHIVPFISSPCRQMQTDKENKVYRKYIFITRWRCFNHLSLNRILPNEDFDEKIRRQCIYDEEVKAPSSKKRSHRSMEEEKVRRDHPEGMKYHPKISSLLLWALCPDDSSSEWFRLFDSEFFAEAYADKNTFRKILNQND